MNNTARVVQGLYRFASLISHIAPRYAGPTLQLPGIFSAYYRGHFKEAAGLGDLHKMFTPVKAGARQAPPASGFLPSMGSFNGPVGKFGGVVVHEDHGLQELAE